MDRNTILEDLKDEIGSYIKSSRSPCISDIAECRRGAHSNDDITNKPFIGIAFVDDILDNEEFATLSSEQTMMMRICLYCYMDSDGLGDYDDLYQLAADIEYFLKYNFSYKEGTTMKKFEAVEGGISAPISFFRMDLEVKYDSTI